MQKDSATSHPGLIKGPSHAKGGIAIEIIETGNHKEVEGAEYYICTAARLSTEIHEFINKTDIEILDAIHKLYKCDPFNPEVSATDFIVCKKVTNDPTRRNRTGTVQELLNLMQADKSCTVDYDVPRNKLALGGATENCGCAHDQLEGGGPAGIKQRTTKLNCLYIHGLEAKFQPEINLELSKLYILNYPKFEIHKNNLIEIYNKYAEEIEINLPDVIIGQAL